MAKKYSVNGKKIMVGARPVMTMKTEAAAKSFAHRLNVLANELDGGLAREVRDGLSDASTNTKEDE